MADLTDDEVKRARYRAESWLRGSAKSADVLLARWALALEKERDELRGALTATCAEAIDARQAGVKT